MIIRNNFIKIISFAIILVITMLLSGCASFGEGLGKGFGEGVSNGVVKALLEKTKTEDNRMCRIWSNGFNGIGQSVDSETKKTKVLMVHGIGHHEAGYSTVLMEKLAKELDLQGVTGPQKNLTITYENGAPSKKDLGNLRLTKLISNDKKRELLFYELTWSSISQEQKEVLTYDQSGMLSFRRTAINNILKKAANDALADPLVYLGTKQEDILISVAQAYCWMIATNYNDFPNKAFERCAMTNSNVLTRAKNDEYFFITHSLGSRITMDAIERITRLLDSDELKRQVPNIAKLHEVVRRRDITIFMLSNQLQLLQIGRKPPEVLNKEFEYCNVNGKNYTQRFANRTRVIAMSDPNDILSYVIPEGYDRKYMDSRVCPEITNININIANVINLFNITEIANPLEAHSGYDKDERVIAMMAYGLGTNETRDIVKNRCEWIKKNNKEFKKDINKT